MSTPIQSPAPRCPGRRLLLLGLALALAGPLLYGLQLTLARLDTPWYAPALALVGLLLIALALRRRATVPRILALLAAFVLAGVQTFFLTSYSRLPAYAGTPAGEPFPDFPAVRAAGRTFARADLARDRATVLVFFRGHW